MKNFKIIIVVLLFFVTACSTQKNTPLVRTYHNLTAHYNVYFNGLVSYEEGVKKTNEYKDDYTMLLPIYKYSIEEATKSASSQMDGTLTKMGKTIKVHSITVKPKLKGSLTPKQKEFLQKNEYCKWIDDAYLLIGKADLYKQEYDKSLRAFHQILNTYKGENTRFDAELWISKVYIEQKKYKEALNLLIELENDIRLPKRLLKDLNLTFADYYIRVKDYRNSIDRLQTSMKYIKKKREKARYYFILAQLESLQGNNNEADNYFKKVVKISSNYDMTFSAKINRAVLASNGKDNEQLKRQLLKLTKDEKNEEYLDQIYYAIAILDLKRSDTTSALKYLKLSTQNSTNNNTQKALSFLSIADIYFNKKEFLNSGFYYDSAMQYLSKNYPDYDNISKRAKNTGLLVRYLGEVEYQDSLQRIAKMPEKQRMAIIDSIIQSVVKKEQLRNQNEVNPYFDPNDPTFQTGPSTQGGKWYMYNPTLISRGKNEFKKKWGNRKLEDNWRRKNKSSANISNTDTTEVDSTRVTDNKKPEFYLQNLPLTDSLMAISNNKIESSLFFGAGVYEERLNDVKSAISIYQQLLKRFPESKYKLETYYKLYNLYTKLGDNSNAQKYKKLLITEFPTSKYANILIDPSYKDRLISEQQAAFNIYYQALDKYERNEIESSAKLIKKGIANYKGSDAFPYYLFLKAKIFGQYNQKDSMKNYLNIIVNDFAESEIASIAKDILQMMTLSKYDYDIYKLNTKEEFYFAIYIKKKEVDPAFNFQLKLASETFSKEERYKINNKNITSDYEIVTVEKFNDLETAKKFLQYVNSKPEVFENLTEYKTFIISKNNYSILLKDKIIEKYLEFYDKNYR